MTVTANWFVDLGTVEEDPFGTRPQQVGQPIDLLGGEPALMKRLLALVQQEGDLDEAGTTCSIREQKDATCSACPLRHTDPLEGLTALCNIGVAMERTMTSMAILRAGPSPREA